MTNNTSFTEAELLADLGMAPQAIKIALKSKELAQAKEQLELTPAQAKEVKGFLLKQYPLVSTKYFTIYLQSTKGFPLASLDLSEISEAELVSYAISCASFRRVGKPTTGALATALLNIEAKWDHFHTTPDIHKAMLVSLIEAGGELDISKIKPLAFPLAAIELYLNDLVAFLVDGGYESPEDYLKTKAKPAKSINSGLTVDQLTSLWDDL